MALSLAWFIPQNVFAANVNARLSSYQDNNGLERYRADVNGSLSIEYDKGVLTSTSWSLGLQRDWFAFPVEDAGADEEEKITSSSSATTLTFGQTWAKLTETRILGAYTRGEEDSSRTLGFGGSHWLFHENYQVSLDVSHTWSSRPFFQYLDVDSMIVTVPTNIESTGTTASLRQLISPTTIGDYAVSYVSSSNRPAAVTYSVNFKQFVTPLNGAIHGGVARAINRGRVTTETTYGQVDAWLATVAWLQNLWGSARGKLGYRYYREDQKTRAYGDEFAFGSDLVSLGLVQGLVKDDSMELSMLASKYITSRSVETNMKTDAAIIEAGISAKF